MGDYHLDKNDIHTTPSKSDNFEIWTPEQLADYLSDQGLSSTHYKKCILQHKISGKLAPLLTDLDLKEMGISIIGDRMKFKLIVDKLRRKSRMSDRSRCLWMGQERVFFSKVTEKICTLGGCCPIDPSTYRLMNSYIKIKKVQPFRLGPMRLNCCTQYTSNNVDLTYLSNVDVIGVPAPCCERILCCAPGKDIVDIEIRGMGGDVFYHKIVLEEGEGDSVANLILHGLEGPQQMDRE